MAGKSKYKFKNIDFFDKIDSEEKAYFLGLIFADGSLNDKLKTLQLALVSDDAYLLELFNDFIYYNRPLRTITYKNVNHREQKQVTVTGKHIYEQMQKYGLTQNKSINGKWVKWNLIPKDLQHHFIRGYFDGDGCIYINPEKEQKHITFTGSTNFVENVRAILKEEALLGKGNISCRNKEHSYNSTIAFGGNLQADRIRDYLYKNATIFLKRKKEKFDQ